VIWNLVLICCLLIHILSYLVRVCKIKKGDTILINTTLIDCIRIPNLDKLNNKCA